MTNIDYGKLDLAACQAQAADYHGQGFNCAQAVACTLAPALGFDADTAFRLMDGFGAGMGGMTQTCGAISGAVAILSLVNSEGMENPTTKGKSYKLSREAAARFKEKNSTTVCRELKGIGSDSGPLRSCPGCIDDAVEIAIELLNELRA
jgi:C_GCAxxG_C_C family probable redox protein